MQITKQFKIFEVRATKVTNASFQIILAGNPMRLNQENLSSLTLDLSTCIQYNIPMSLDLVGRNLICSFENRELPLQNNGQRINIKSLGNDELQIQSLKKNETISPIFYTIPPSKYEEVLRTLELSSFGGGDSMHIHMMPCPFYHLIIELTDEEYEMCKVMPANSVVRVNFRLA
jgi:hypothetical protein